MTLAETQEVEMCELRIHMKLYWITYGSPLVISELVELADYEDAIEAYARDPREGVIVRAEDREDALLWCATTADPDYWVSHWPSPYCDGTVLAAAANLGDLAVAVAAYADAVSAVVAGCATAAEEDLAYRTSDEVGQVYLKVRDAKRL